MRRRNADAAGTPRQCDLIINAPRGIAKSKHTIKKTRKCKKILINLAINYGSKNEIINSIKILRRNKKTISVKNLEQNFYTKNLPDPDLLIRTGGKKRLSNFLLWDMAYTELFFTECFWPDFDEEMLNVAFDWFYERKRRFGKRS